MMKVIAALVRDFGMSRLSKMRVVGCESRDADCRSRDAGCDR